MEHFHPKRIWRKNVGPKQLPHADGRPLPLPVGEGCPTEQRFQRGSEHQHLVAPDRLLRSDVQTVIFGTGPGLGPAVPLATSARKRQAPALPDELTPLEDWFGRIPAASATLAITQLCGTSSSSAASSPAPPPAVQNPGMMELFGGAIKVAVLGDMTPVDPKKSRRAPLKRPRSPVAQPRALSFEPPSVDAAEPKAVSVVPRESTVDPSDLDSYWSALDASVHASVDPAPPPKTPEKRSRASPAKKRVKRGGTIGVDNAVSPLTAPSSRRASENSRRERQGTLAASRAEFPLHGFGATLWVQALSRSTIKGGVPTSFEEVCPSVPVGEGTVSCALREFLRAWVRADKVCVKVIGHVATARSVQGMAMCLEGPSLPPACWYLPLDVPDGDDAADRAVVLDKWIRSVLNAEWAVFRAKGGPCGAAMPLKLDGASSVTLSVHERWVMLARLFSWGSHQVMVAYESKSILYSLLDALPEFSGAAPRIGDIRVAAWMLDPDAVSRGVARTSSERSSSEKESSTRKPDLAEIAEAYGVPVPGADEASPSPSGGKAKLAANLELHLRVWDALLLQLNERGMAPAYWHIESRIPLQLAAMEVIGVPFDPLVFDGVDKMIASRIASLEAAAHHLAGHEFLLTSPLQVSEVLYKQLGLVAKQKQVAYKASNSLKKQHESTGEDALESLVEEHPLPKIILEVRKVSKLHNTFVEPFIKVCVPVDAEHRHRLHPAAEVEGELLPSRIHSCLLQTSTATGRLSSRNPNLQNIPKSTITFPPIDPSGWKGHAFPPVPSIPDLNVRSGIRATSADREIMSVDYRQIEMRLLAHFAGDAALLKATSGVGLTTSQAEGPPPDIYSAVAAQCFSIPIESVSDTQRSQAKTVCLGLMYGQGKKDAALKLKVSDADAAKLQQSFLRRFPGIDGWIKGVVAFAKRTEWVPTVTGRRRLLPAIRASHTGARTQAQRQAVNAVIQGSAADIIKAAMTQLSEILTAARDIVHGAPLGRDSGASGSLPEGELRVASLPEPVIRALASADIIHQVHDELLIEIPRVPEVRPVVEAAVRHALVVLAPRLVAAVGSQWLATSPVGSEIVSIHGGFRCSFEVRFSTGSSYGSLTDD
jgi:DNA polymerase I-like protein with 3'-5' exonuclease and polymerase domains